MKKIMGLAMHVHHNILFEYCYDFNERVRAIKETKPENEQPVRLKLFKMLSKEARAELPEKLIKAYTEWDKASAEWKKASAEWDKANAEWNKVSAEWDKAYTEWNKASAEWYKAYTEWNKVSAEWNKVSAEWDKAYTEWNKVSAEWENRKSWHKKYCGCKEWNGEEIIF